jgi:hypothetical protein
MYMAQCGTVHAFLFSTVKFLTFNATRKVGRPAIYPECPSGQIELQVNRSFNRAGSIERSSLAMGV